MNLHTELLQKPLKEFASEISVRKIVSNPIQNLKLKSNQTTSSQDQELSNNSTALCDEDLVMLDFVCF